MKIRCAIIEDEYYVLQGLLTMLHRLRPDYEVVGTADDVGGAAQLLSSGGLELLIADTQLSDGTCFDALSQSAGSVPVIFLSSLKAYRRQSEAYSPVDYLMLPVDERRMGLALDKFENTLSTPSHNINN